MSLRDTWLATIGDESERMLLALDRGPDRPVAACPGWTVTDLVVHVGEVHRFWTAVVTTNAKDGDEAALIPDIPVPAVAELADWLREGVAQLHAAITSRAPDKGSWNWSRGPQVVGWIPRRMAHETAVHRWDAEHAVRGRARGIRPVELAVDGLQELLSLFVGINDARYGGRDAWVRVAPTDADRVFDLRLLPPRVHLSDGIDRAPDTVLRAAAGDLLLNLWGRPVDVELEGDADLVQEVRAHLDLV